MSTNIYDISSDIQIPIAILICISYTIITLLISRYCTSINQSGTDVPWFHPSSVAAIIGLIIGGVTNSFNLRIQFNDNIFFYVVLPPIIFTAGYTLKKKKFFQYLHYIALYGIIGSLVNFVLIALAAYYYKSMHLSLSQSLLLSSVLAANDEISAISLIKQSDFPRLGALVFGEGVLNDALSIVLFQALLTLYHKSLSKKSSPDMEVEAGSHEVFAFAVSLMISVIYQLFVSLFIGLACGLCNARTLKVFTFSRKYPIHQVTLVMLTGYLAYSLAEAVEVSGILTLFVTAVTLAHYSWHSLSKSAKLSSRLAFVSLSDAAEGFAFAYVGLSSWDMATGPINMTFSLYMLLVVVIARFMTIFILNGLYNLISSIRSASRSKDVSSETKNGSQSKTIPFLELIAFGLGGVVRGCLCWAQVLQVGGGDEAKVLVQTTLVIVMATTVGCGLILPLLIPRLTDMLKASKRVDGDPDAETTQIANKKYQSSSRKSSVRGKSPSQSNIPDDDDEISTYSMHLEGSINDSDEDDYRRHSPDTGYIPIQGMDTMESTSTRPITVTPPPDNDTSHYGSMSMYNSYRKKRKSDHLMEENLTTSDMKRRYHRRLEKYSLLFVLWIRIDEQYLKPLFGGSSITTKKSKQKALNMTKSLNAFEMLSPIKTIDVDTIEEEDADLDDNFDGIEMKNNESIDFSYENIDRYVTHSSIRYPIGGEAMSRDNSNESNDHPKDLARNSNVESISLLYDISKEDIQP